MRHLHLLFGTRLFDISFGDRHRNDAGSLPHRWRAGKPCDSAKLWGQLAQRGIAVVFAMTFAIIVLSYRSLWVGLLLMVSLGSAAPAAMAIQSVAKIGVNVNTLPIQAIGVGIGVDYAILAIAFTASTLVAGIIFWIPISSLRFSAEMSLLLSVRMTVNAFGAVLRIPALLRLLPERASRAPGAVAPPAASD